MTQDAKRFAARLWQCYVLAGRRVAFDGPDSVLVHGSIQGYGRPRNGHAWVELPSGDIWEPITEETYPALVFEAMFHSITEARYTRAELITAINETLNWGPWVQPTQEGGTG